MVPVKKPKPGMNLSESSMATIKKKKKKQRNGHNFTRYLYKLLKSVTPVGISKKSMLIMNNFVNDMLEKIAAEASMLVSHTKSQTLTSRDIKSAVTLLIPGELGKYANLQAANAVRNYYESKAAQDK